MVPSFDVASLSTMEVLFAKRASWKIMEPETLDHRTAPSWSVTPITTRRSFPIDHPCLLVCFQNWVGTNAWEKPKSDFSPDSRFRDRDQDLFVLSFCAGVKNEKSSEYIKDWSNCNWWVSNTRSFALSLDHCFYCVVVALYVNRRFEVFGWKQKGRLRS